MSRVLPDGSVIRERPPQVAGAHASAHPFAGALLVGVSMRQTTLAGRGWCLFRPLVMSGHVFAWLGLDVPLSPLRAGTVLLQLRHTRGVRAFFQRVDAKQLFPLLDERCAHERTELGPAEEPRIHAWVLSEGDVALAALSEVR